MYDRWVVRVKTSEVSLETLRSENLQERLPKFPQMKDIFKTFLTFS